MNAFVASGRKIDVAAAWLCIGSAALNWWNLFGQEVTPLRLLPAVAMTAIALFLFVRGYGLNISKSQY